MRKQFIAAAILIPVIGGSFLYLLLDKADALSSITFLVGVPAVISLLPLLFASEEEMRSYRVLVFLPWVTTFSLVIFLLLVKLEPVACLIILLAPFILVGTTILFLVRSLLRSRGKRDALGMAILFPIAIFAVEALVEKPIEIRHVEHSVVMRADPATVWNNVTRVRRIEPEEMDRNFWNLIGIPNPVEATLDHDGIGGVRIGRFERDLRFIEEIVEWQPNRFVEFTVRVDTSSLNDPMIDRHVLTGNYFAFGTVSYRITPVGGDSLRLTLACSYRLHSTVNRYSALWGDAVIGDFERRLLAVIKSRCEVSSISP